MWDICPRYDRRGMQDSSMVPQDHVEPTPLRAWAKTYPGPVQSGPLRRDSAAEATIRVSGRAGEPLSAQPIIVSALDATNAYLS